MLFIGIFILQTDLLEPHQCFDRREESGYTWFNISQLALASQTSQTQPDKHDT